MIICKYNNYSEIPGSEFFSEKIPVFATQNYADFLKDFKGHNICWFVYFEENDTVYYLLPFAVINKLIFRKGYFVTGVNCLGKNNSIDKEKDFLESVINFIKQNKLCDWIQQGPNWALFNTYPSGSNAAKFGTYRVNLKDNTEFDVLKKMNRFQRKDINHAVKNNVEIKKGFMHINDGLGIIENTSAEAGIHSPSPVEIEALSNHLNDNLTLYVSYFESLPQSAAIFIQNSYCIYGLYAGSIPGSYRGANANLFWEAIKDGINNKCCCFDFVGGRINTEPGSKLERIQQFKKKFGSEFIQGYIWKMSFSIIKYAAYRVMLRIFYLLKNKKFKPDIIDQEL